METPPAIQQISDSYEKFFIEIWVDDCAYHMVWGADSTDDGNDKLVLDKDNNIVLFGKQADALDYILESPDTLFDGLNLEKWAKSGIENGTYTNCSFSLSHLLRLIEEDRFINLYKTTQHAGLDWVNFINLVSDYSHQTGNEHLLELRRGSSIDSFWDFIYDTFFWTIPERELAERQKEAVAKFDYLEFKADAMALLNHFKSHLVIWPW